MVGGEGTSVDPPLSSVAEALVGLISGPFFAQVGSGGSELASAVSLTDCLASAAQRMAASALEMAVIDLGYVPREVPLADSLGTGGWVEAGAVVGIPPDRSFSTLLEDVEEWVGRGYRRLRLKIEPGLGLGRQIRAWCEVSHPQLRLQADANGSYSVEPHQESSVERLKGTRGVRSGLHWSNRLPT